MSDDNHELARLTADVVLIARRDGVAHVLLIERGWDPFAGRWALPGGHVDAGEYPEAAALRELAEETGVDLTEHRAAWCLIDVYAAPGRDPRGRYVTWAYLAVVPEFPAVTAGDDATAARWVPLADALTNVSLAFDHHQVLTDAGELIESAVTA